MLVYKPISYNSLINGLSQLKNTGNVSLPNIILSSGIDVSGLNWVFLQTIIYGKLTQGAIEIRLSTKIPTRIFFLQNGFLYGRKNVKMLEYW